MSLSAETATLIKPSVSAVVPGQESLFPNWQSITLACVFAAASSAVWGIH